MGSTLLFDLIEHYNSYPGAYTAGACLFMVLIAAWMLRSKGEKAAAVPGLAISSGIFFTFLSLAVSLLSVSDAGVDTQYSTLLNGLSTAFWTSVMGIGISIVARYKLVTHKADSPFSDIQQEVAYVRREIKGLGNDISTHVTASLKAALTEYTETASQQLQLSTSHMEKLNHSLAESISGVESSFADISSNLQSLADETHAIINTTKDLVQGTRDLSKEGDKLYNSQAQWLDGIQQSMGSIAALAPEAKNVFKAIDAMNQNYQSCITKMEERVQKNQELFVSDIDRHTAHVIQQIASVDDKYYKSLTQHLENLDDTIKKSFNTVINDFGNGMVELAKRQTGIVKETVDQLDLAKQQLTAAYTEGINQHAEAVNKAVDPINA